MHLSPQDYVDSVPSPGKDWLVEFLGYMDAQYPDLQPVMFRQRPMFKVGESYLLFTVAKEHFTLHTLNFDLIEGVKDKLPRAAFGKGSVKVRFADVDAKPVLKALCDEVIRVNRLPSPPPVDVVPERPYAESLQAAFGGVKAAWLPLYTELVAAARAQLPPFTEYFPAVNVRWKHGSTFAEISAVSSALRVEFYADGEHPEYGAIKVVRLSKNRVAHTIALTDASGLPELLPRLLASYALTQGKRG